MQSKSQSQKNRYFYFKWLNEKKRLKKLMEESMYESKEANFSFTQVTTQEFTGTVRSYETEEKILYQLRNGIVGIENRADFIFEEEKQHVEVLDICVEKVFETKYKDGDVFHVRCNIGKNELRMLKRNGHQDWYLIYLNSDEYEAGKRVSTQMKHYTYFEKYIESKSYFKIGNIYNSFNCDV